MYTYPYQILKKRLNDKIAELKVVDWFLDQFNKTDKSTMVHTAPGVFIQFRPMATEQLSFGQQMAEVEIVLHVFSINMYDNDKRVEKVNANDHAVLVDKVHKSISGFGAKLSFLPAFAGLLNTDQDQTIFNSLRRQLVNPPHAIRSLQVTELTYKTLVYDSEAVKLLSPTVQPIEITVTIH
jgi:hypothetical protein